MPPACAPVDCSSERPVAITDEIATSEFLARGVLEGKALFNYA